MTKHYLLETTSKTAKRRASNAGLLYSMNKDIKEDGNLFSVETNGEYATIATTIHDETEGRDYLMKLYGDNYQKYEWQPAE